MPGAALYHRRKMGVQGGERQIIVCAEKKIGRYQLGRILSIKNLNDLPDIDQLKSIRKYVFVIDEDTYALRQAVENSLTKLRLKYPEYEFWAIYGGI